MAFCGLEVESLATGLTPYEIRRSLFPGFPGFVPQHSHLIQYFIHSAQDQQGNN